MCFRIPTLLPLPVLAGVHALLTEAFLNPGGYAELQSQLNILENTFYHRKEQGNETASS